ncbi:hypothetical protein [Halovulum sp. GXIMD14793]
MISIFGRNQPEQRDLSAFGTAPWTQVTQAQLGRAADLPSMISFEERQLYYWLTHNVIQDAGAVVDLGCFLGGSTGCLAQGMAARKSVARVQAYDTFTAGARQKRKHLYARGVPEFEGNDIYPYAQDYLAPWADHVALHRGDILKIGWSDAPIELLVFDAGKSPRTADGIAAAFFPALIPGRSLLVQQDYLLPNHPWLICQLELLADAFHPIARTEKNSVLFQTSRQITRRDLRKARTADLSDKKMLSLMEQARVRMAPFDAASTIDQAIAMLKANPGQRLPRHFSNAP